MLSYDAIKKQYQDLLLIHNGKETPLMTKLRFHLDFMRPQEQMMPIPLQTPAQPQ